MERRGKKNIQLGKKVNLFSSYNRDLLIEKLKSNSFDLIIIGGGITGAGVCIDAISRGLRVCLIEMNDFASGTSSKSTKLIHGGLRYLEQFKFSLVRETGTERAVLHEIAPHVVKSEKMLLPISKDGKLNRLTTPLALSVYDYLAKVDKKDKKKSLDKESTCKYEPLLKKKNILGGAIYSEYRTDDFNDIIAISSISKTFYNLNKKRKIELLFYKNVYDFISKYIQSLNAINKSLNVKDIYNFVLAIEKLKKNNGRLFILGIGGSAGNASHAVNDFRKLCEIDAYSPIDNVSEVTARTNDEGFETIFVQYLKISNLKLLNYRYNNLLLCRNTLK